MVKAVLHMYENGTVKPIKIILRKGWGDERN
jgi:hypothetical protein